MSPNESVANLGASKLKTAVSHIGIAEGGAPFIIGCRCSICTQVFAGARATCAKCGARSQMIALKLRETGRIHTYSVVHRSFPGIKTPFVSATVSLDGGGNVQGTVRNVATDAATALFNLPVRLQFEVTDQVDREGVSFLAYYFTPVEEAGRVFDV